MGQDDRLHPADAEGLPEGHPEPHCLSEGAHSRFLPVSPSTQYHFQQTLQHLNH